MRILSQKALKEILAKHKKWLNDEEGGEKANLQHAYLPCANLGNVDLQYADLYDAYLRGADLREADLRGADLQEADLQEADLRGADLKCASLRKADLRKADLRKADLRNVDLYDAKVQKVQRPWLLYAGDIGSRNAETIYFADYDNIHCGCWNHNKGGTLAEFKKRIDEVYPADDKKHFMYRLGYLVAIKMFSLMREAYVKSATEVERRKCY